MPRSLAIDPVRNACHGSVTTTAVDQPRRCMLLCTAVTLLRVSLPVGTATMRRAGTPFSVSHLLPAAASVNRSPSRLPPTVMIRGATSSRHRLRAWTRRAVNTEDGRPSNCAAPRTTIASDTRRSSWRAVHHTRPAVRASTSRAMVTTAATVLAARRSRINRWSPAVAALAHDRGTTGLQPRDRDPERRAGDVVEARVVEEVDGVGVTAVLAADADVEVGAGRPALLRGDLHHAPDALSVQRLERRDAEDAQVEVAAEERRLHVVAGEAPTHLGQVVGAEGEELGGLRDLAGGER